MFVKYVAIIHCHGNSSFKHKHGFLEFRHLVFPYAPEAVDVSSVEVEAVFHPWSILPCIDFCPIVQRMDENARYKKTLLIPILLCRTVTKVSH